MLIERKPHLKLMIDWIFSNTKLDERARTKPMCNVLIMCAIVLQCFNIQKLKMVLLSRYLLYTIPIWLFSVHCNGILE